MMITSRSGRVALNPTWYQSAAGFATLGIVHILSGIDHLLFLLCLLIPVRGVGEILRIVTAFTIGHSITLVGSAYDLAPAGAWFPPLVETLIAASILYMAIENILSRNLRARWLIAGVFGLIHGFGFAYGLKENLQFAGKHLLVSLFSFNVGIEIGQIFVLIITLPLLALLLRRVLVGPAGMIILSTIVAHTAWHWMIERGDVLWQVEWTRARRSRHHHPRSLFGGTSDCRGRSPFFGKTNAYRTPADASIPRRGRVAGLARATERSLSRNVIRANSPAISSSARRRPAAGIPLLWRAWPTLHR